MNSETLAEGRPARRRNRVLIGVGFSVLLVGGIVLLIFFVRPWLHWKRAQSWPSTEAQISASEIEVSLAKQSKSYEAKFEYTFNVDGQDWTGSQYGFFVFSGSKEASEELVKRYPVGKTANIFYNPSQPSDALMDRSLGPAIWFAIGPFVLTIAGSVLLCLGLRGRIPVTNV